MVPPVANNLKPEAALLTAIDFVIARAIKYSSSKRGALNSISTIVWLPNRSRLCAV